MKKKTKKKFNKNKSTFLDRFVDNFLYYFIKENAPKDTLESLPFEQIFNDGTVRIKDNLYSKTIKFEDLNYRLSSEEEQYNILDRYAELINYFDTDTSFQFSFINTKISEDKLLEQIQYISDDDKLKDVTTEYYNIIKEKLTQGNNGIVKNKYISFTTSGKSYNELSTRLNRMSEDIVSNLESIGVESTQLDKKGILEVIKDIYYNDGSHFYYDKNIDYKYQVAPKKIDTRDRSTIKINNNIFKFGVVKIEASDMNDKMLSEILDIDSSLIVNISLKPYKILDAKKKARQKLTELDRMKYDSIKKSQGIDIVPYKLKKQIDDVNQLLDDLDNRNDKLFDMTMLIGVIAETKEKANDLYDRINGILNKHSCNLNSLFHEQEQALNSVLPINNLQVKEVRSFHTTGLCMFVPFNSQELITKGDSIYYGVNSISDNIIMFDRKLLKTPNALYLGTPGAGKSFLAKKEITGVFLTTNDDIFICDPEAEYLGLVNELGGVNLELSLNSKVHINPFDIDLNYNEDGDPVQFKAEFILSFCEQLLGGAKGLSKKEIAIIDKGVRHIYMPWKANPIKENIPILEDLYNFLLEYDDIDAKNMAIALEMYVHGSLNLFNHRTNIDVNNRLINFNIKNLGKQLINVGMLVVQDMIWSKVASNRKNKKYTWFYIDEFHLLLRNPQTAEFSLEIWKRFRKWGGLPTGMTQNVKDFLQSLVAENILDTSDCKILLNQNSGDRDLLQEQLKITPAQMKYITNSPSGSGLIFYDKIVVPFYDKFPTDTKLYKVMSSKLIG